MRIINEFLVSTFSYLSIAWILKYTGSKYFWLPFILMFLHYWDLYRDNKDKVWGEKT